MPYTKFVHNSSLEVGEHLPKKYEETFFENLAKTSKEGIILSWAIPGQGGDGHFNEQPNAYVKEKMTNLGFTNNLKLEEAFRSASTLTWFQNTIMVFERNPDSFLDINGEVADSSEI